MISVLGLDIYRLMRKKNLKLVVLVRTNNKINIDLIIVVNKFYGRRRFQTELTFFQSYRRRRRS